MAFLFFPQYLLSLYTEKVQINVSEEEETSTFGISLNKRLEGLTEITVAALFQRLAVNRVQNLSTYMCLHPLCIPLFYSLLGVST